MVWLLCRKTFKKFWTIYQQNSAKFLYLSTIIYSKLREIRKNIWQKYEKTYKHWTRPIYCWRQPNVNLQQKKEWLGFKLSRSGVSQGNENVQGETQQLRPENFKDCRSYLGAVNQMNRFLPELASICFPFRHIIEKDAIWKWECI